MSDYERLMVRLRAVHDELWYSYRDPIAEGMEPRGYSSQKPMPAIDALELACSMLDLLLEGEPDERIEGWCKTYRDGKLVDHVKARKAP